MLAELLIAIIIFILSIMLYIIKTEGFKLSIAGIVGLIGLTWGFLANAWSNFTVFIITPAINTIFGSAEISFYNVSAVMLFIAWVWIVIIAVFNIIITFNRGGVSLFRNWTESKTDGL